MKVTITANLGIVDHVENNMAKYLKDQLMFSNQLILNLHAAVLCIS